MVNLISFVRYRLLNFKALHLLNTFFHGFHSLPRPLAFDTSKNELHIPQRGQNEMQREKNAAVYHNNVLAVLW